MTQLTYEEEHGKKDDRIEIAHGHHVHFFVSGFDVKA